MNKVRNLLSLFLIIMISLFGVPLNANAQIQENVIVNYIDVGQGDSELIQISGKNILIDAGNNDDLAYNYLKNLGITKLDYVIATHPHSDHIGGMATIIDNFDIGTFYAPKVTATTRVFERMVTALNNKNVKIKVPKVGDTLNIGNVTLEFLAPNSPKYRKVNNYSIVTKLKYGNTSFIFTGDAESLSEGEILQKQLDISADVLKLGHHGSRTSTSKGFLNAVNPKYAIVSAGKGNDYGHPHEETIKKLNEKNIQVFRTDISGTIIAVSNGSTINFTNEDDTSSSIEKETSDNSVWIANNKSKVYHSNNNCSKMKNPIKILLEDAKNRGLRPCSRCVK
ncbi:MBL fold protein [Clostridium septicum]|uniref:MBL fold metallo-hydrolase n=2 Tax=Clostridium septicum TaxID=1504 RepID=A0A9N7JJB9_CLOSE|nr:ComEC/Rec2 family competence protein [Clostridium septicum]AYE32961.1 MBL fold protein [Clostridium septicum]QAS61133.1 MBL fold metallo-hydrolase [Clostridium septicum]UEC19524.1 MBL fold metallo-hydrolase [Clostridium septicum]USR99523.1 MBL fold metallo-hydrolase [Clostridium septicum]